MKTTALRTQDIEQKWYIVDCTGKKLGRLSVQVANILRGKNKPEYTPNSDVGDFVILLNAKNIEVTGKKATDKIYYRHSGFPGGIKQIGVVPLGSWGITEHPPGKHQPRGELAVINSVSP